jgi:hypothetical protein
VLECPPDILRAGIIKDVERLITEAFRPASSESEHNCCINPLERRAADA